MDVTLIDLWLAILVSAVVMFFVGFIVHTVLPHHKSDVAGAPNEEALLEHIRSSSIKPGVYMFPFVDCKEFKDPEVKKKYYQGPNGILQVWPNAPTMGPNMAKTFIWYVVVGIFVAYLSQIYITQGAEFMDVFRFTGAATIMAYCLGPIGGAIWYRQPLRTTINYLADGIAFGILTGLIFAWLWPAMQTPSMPAIG